PRWSGQGHAEDGGEGGERVVAGGRPAGGARGPDDGPGRTAADDTRTVCSGVAHASGPRGPGGAEKEEVTGAAPGSAGENLFTCGWSGTGRPTRPTGIGSATSGDC